jgi:hypothetical protein
VAERVPSKNLMTLSCSCKIGKSSAIDLGGAALRPRLTATVDDDAADGADVAATAVVVAVLAAALAVAFSTGRDMPAAELLLLLPPVVAVVGNAKVKPGTPPDAGAGAGAGPEAGAGAAAGNANVKPGTPAVAGAGAGAALLEDDEPMANVGITGLSPAIPAPVAGAGVGAGPSAGALLPRFPNPVNPANVLAISQFLHSTITELLLNLYRFQFRKDEMGPGRSESKEN